MLMALRQLSMLGRPLLAALLIALAGDSGGMVADARGLAFAFGFDCLSFLVSAWTLVESDGPQKPAALGAAAVGAASLPPAWPWSGTMSPCARCFIYWGTVSLLIGGSMQVALPVWPVKNCTAPPRSAC